MRRQEWSAHTWYPDAGVPAERFDEVLAVPVATDRTSDDQEVDPWGPWYLATPEVLAGGEPSHSICATAAGSSMMIW